MAIRNIRQENDEILRKRSKEVEVVDDKIRELLEDMVETMHKYNGVGLAAVQVGILKRVIVIDLYDGKGIKEGDKSIAFSLTFGAQDRTLVDEEINSCIDKIIKGLENKHGATLRK